MEKIRSSRIGLVTGIVIGMLFNSLATAIAWSLAHARFDAIGTSGIVLVIGIVLGLALGVRIVMRLHREFSSTPYEQQLNMMVASTWFEALQLAKRYPDRDTLIGELRRCWSEINDKNEAQMVDPDA